MRVLEFDRLRRARVWLGDSPNAGYQADAVVNHALVGDAGVMAVDGVATVEVFVPLGARFDYGLLGGHLEPDDSGRLVLEIHTADHELPFDGSLARGLDDVRVGLPSQFCQAVINGVESARTSQPIPSGQLTLQLAAHGPVGSSPIVFQHLAATLLHLLCMLDREPSDAELVALLAGQFR